MKPTARADRQRDAGERAARTRRRSSRTARSAAPSSALRAEPSALYSSTSTISERDRHDHRAAAPSRAAGSRTRRPTRSSCPRAPSPRAFTDRACASVTTEPMSRPSTLNLSARIAAVGLAVDRWRGPVARSIWASSRSGTCAAARRSARAIVADLRRRRRARRAGRQHAHRHRPLVLPHRRRDACPPSAVSTTSCASSTLIAGARERRAVEARSAAAAPSASRYSSRSTMPGTLLQRGLAPARASSRICSRSVPKIFSTTLPRTPLTRLLDVVLDRLREVEAHAGNLGQRRAHLRRSARPCHSRARHSSLRLQAHERLAHVDALVVGAVLGPALLAQRLRHLGERRAARSRTSSSMSLAVARARCSAASRRRSRCRPRRARAGTRCRAASATTPASASTHGAPRAARAGGATSQREQRAVARRAAARRSAGSCSSRVAAAAAAAAHSAGTSVSANTSAPTQREAVGQRQRPEDAALDALQREHRDQRGDDDRHRVERRPRDVDRRARRSARSISRRVAGRSLAQLVHHVLDQHHGAVDAGCRSRSRPSRSGSPAGRARSRPMNAVSSASGMTDATISDAAQAAQEQPHHADDQQRRRTAGCGAPSRACSSTRSVRS